MTLSILRRLLVCVLLLSMAPLVAAQTAGDATEPTIGEQLLFVTPPRWIEVYSGREENLSTTEYVPEDQELEDWDQMLSIQIVLGMADANPETVLANVALHLAQQCHEFDAKPISLGGTDGNPTLGMMLMCGEHAESGGGEFSLLRGIAGHENFYLLQKIWRTKTYATADAPPVALNDRKFWLGYLAYLRVCDPAKAGCLEDAEPAP
jgi:hypothetical protein